MKVLFRNRPDSYSRWGGDVTQMLQTQKHLRRFSVNADVSLEDVPDLAPYDLVHVFNLQTASIGLQQIKQAKSAGKPVALSTIFWDMRHVRPTPETASLPMKLRRQAGRCWRRFRDGAPPPAPDVPAFQSEMLRLADVLLPNSHAELEQLVLLYKLPEARLKAWVVPNAAEIDESNIGPEPESLQRLPKEYILEAARFEAIKGQLLLVEGLRSRPDLPVVLIGGNLETGYGKQVRALGSLRGNTFLLPQAPQAVMPHFFRRARVHVLPSLRESPGLSTLEAALCGANCVVSFHAPISEYFLGDAWMCNPSDPASIAEAVIDAWNAPRIGSLGNRVRAQFNYDRVAEATSNAYRWLLAGGKKLVD